MRSIKNNNSKKTESILISFALIAIAGISYALSVFLTIISSNNQNFNLLSTFWLTVCMLIFFVIIPFFIARKIYGIDYRCLNINLKNYTIYILIGFIFFKYILKINSINIFRNLIVASSEEFLFRFIIFEILLRGFDKKYAIVIGSILFALILHLNADVLINIISKFPMSIVLYILYDKFGYENAFALHWLNNSLVDFFYM